jgi:hypothetical protein
MQTGRPFKFLVRHHGIFFTGLCRFLYRIMQISHVIFRRQIAANIAQAAGAGVLKRWNLRQTAAVPVSSAVEHCEGILFGARSPL